jgi:TRAP-type mannitol/chloroaromatic compound transport system substrate-binding protein
MDIKQGFHQVAKWNYFPGWHQQVSVSHLLMNKKAYDSLPKSYQKMIQMAAGHQVLYNYAESEAANPEAMQELTKKYGVNVQRWTDDQIAAFEKAWLEVIKEESAKDPIFKRISDDYLAFRAKYKIWGDAQTLKPTYLKH